MYQKSIHVLLVEDSPSDANLLRHTFSRVSKGEWELVCVERLSDAIDVCSDRAFDIVLLDLSLPDSDGLETVAQFQVAAPDIPIVVLTGVDDEEFALQAVAQGAQDYLVKDQITMQLLVRTIRYAIERGQVLAQLHDSERRFRGIFDQTFQSMGLLTPEGILLEVNQTTRDFCGTKQEDIGLPLWEVKSWNYSSATQEWLKTAIASARDGDFVRNEVEVCGVGDEMLWIDFSLKPVKDERGKVVLLIAEGRDISDRKRAEAEMIKALEKERELNELKSNFVSMVSHEFRTPMATIRTSVELLQRFNDKLTPEKKSQYFGVIQTTIKALVELLDQILLLGKTEAGKLKYQPAPLDLENFCLTLTETLQLNAISQHQIIFTCQGEATEVEMDEVLLQHIFTNLLSNAIKYSPAGGKIHFDLNFQDSKATFSVRDEGIGIPLKDQQRLFETFQRCSNVGRIQGTGLGLAIVKNCVDLHGGEIELESQEGVGTTFIVTLPFKRSQDTQ